MRALFGIFIDSLRLRWLERRGRRRTRRLLLVDRWRQIQ